MLTKPQVFYDDTHKQALGYQNPFYLKKAQRIKPTLYDGSVLPSQHVASLVIDDEETLILEEASRSKMLAKQNDPMSKEKKVNTTPINYVELNRLSKDFDVMICVMNSIFVFDDVNVEMQSSKSCVKCVDLDVELLNKQNAYNDLLKSYSQLEKYCISLELTMQLNQEIFQKDSLSNNQNTLEIPEYFENNDLKAQLQAKDTTIFKLKEHIKSMRENEKEEKVKHEIDEIETINIELEHSVAKLFSKNEHLHKEIVHLKKIYNDQFDSIKKTCALSKEHDDSLTAQLNSKSMENTDLKRQIQDRLDIEPLSHRLKNNRDAHEDYLKKTIENTDTIHRLVEHARTQNPSTLRLCLHVYKIRPGIVSICFSDMALRETQKPEIKVYSRRPKQVKSVVSSKKAKIVESKIANNSEPTHLWESNAIDVPSSSSLVNDMLSRLSSGVVRNLFSFGQFYDADLEVSFRENTCFIRNLEGFDLLSSSRDTNLYTISLYDMLKTSLICLLSKASKTKSWLWHRWLSHLNFACALGKSKKSSHQPKAEDTNQEKLYLLHMDLCGPMRVESINGKKYILVIVDDYSRFTWVRFLRSNDEALDAITKCIKNTKVRLNATVRNVRTDNETEFVNQTLCDFYKNVSISHQTSVARTPQ
ncbi:retrovirus-related pol polyprotein from transposon TNT 1-94 [Tanacetum coccineum]|uniref:Retrovirus-related pol polyprotein from transposon TNT 1-94 n=1 Tax=Tanacetum coccineum TaxID=301880 RepID=A0ABQ5FPI2_9ASTR